MAPLPDNLPFTLCAGCGEVMNLIRSVPSLGMIPELHVFVCPACGEAETKRVLRPSCWIVTRLSLLSNSAATWDNADCSGNPGKILL
jgi:hypothetical protein